MLSFVLTLILTVLIFGAVPKDFLPSGDTGAYWADGIPLGSTLRQAR